MKEYNKILIFIAMCAAIFQWHASSFGYTDKPVTTDSRIKTFVYSENEVFSIVLNYGYQTSIEFADGEEIQTISVGNNYAWQLSPVGRRLFIKPLEDAIVTNMTIITNKRTYQFELQSKTLYGAIDDELVYVVRFFYPDDYEDAIKPQLAEVREIEVSPPIKPYNFNYSITGMAEVAPTKVFDDGIKTFFYFVEYVDGQVPSISYEQNKKVVDLQVKKVGKYFVVNTIAEQFKLTLGGKTAGVINNELLNGANGKEKKRSK